MIARQIIWFLLFLFGLNICFADANTEEDLYFDGYLLGISIKQLDDLNIRVADIPLIEARIPVGIDDLQFKYGGKLMWGLTRFFVEWNYAAGFILYPFGGLLGTSITGRVGSSFLDNISYTGAVGAHFNIPLETNRLLSIGAEYFCRSSNKFLDYVSFGGDKYFNRKSTGIGLSVGFRF